MELPGFVLVLGLSIINFAILRFGFVTLNERANDEVIRPPWGAWALATVTFIVFTMPSLWIVVFFPSLVQVMLMMTTGL